MSRLYMSGIFTVGDRAGLPFSTVLQSLCASNIQTPEEKREPMLPFVLHLSATQNQGNGNPVVERSFSAGQAGVGSAPADTMISAVIEYGFGASLNQLEMDWVPGAYQFPPCAFVSISARLRQTFDPTDRGLTLRCGVVPGEVPGAHVPTYTVPTECGAGYSMSAVVPAKARAYEVYCCGDSSDVKATSASQPGITRYHVLGVNEQHMPPWTPVALLPVTSVANTITVVFDPPANTRGALVFYLQP